MKGLFIVFLLIATMPVASAQAEEFPKHSLRLGINAALFTAGDLIGIGNYGEYSYSFNDHLAIVPRIMSANANRRTDIGSQQASSLGASLSARITPFPEFYRGFKFDVGPLYQRIRGSDSRYGIVPGTPYTVTNSIRNNNFNLFGLFGSCSFGVLDGARLGTGLRLEISTSIREGSLHSELLQAGIYMSVKF